MNHKKELLWSLWVNPKPQSRNPIPKTQSQNHEHPKSPNPKPQTLNPKLKAKTMNFESMCNVSMGNLGRRFERLVSCRGPLVMPNL